ncbi:MAG: hypothetical protein V5A66_05585 [Candidatus Thermoplasmatota archaeon]
MSKKMIGGGITLLIVGLIFIVVVQFMIMPSPTGWEDASEDMKTADVGESMWIEGEITSEEEGISSYSYTIDDVDEPVKSSEDLGEEGEEITVKVKKKENSLNGEYIEVRKIATGYPSLFYLGIGLALIGGVLLALTYFRGDKEDSEQEDIEEETPPLEHLE